MMTRKELSDLLRSVNVEELAGASGVSTKTIYRLRHQNTSPKLDTVAALVKGAARCKTEAAQRARKP